jgi:hypothetical protein
MIWIFPKMGVPDPKKKTHFWLVVSTPLINMISSVGMIIDDSQHMESHNIHVPKHQHYKIGFSTINQAFWDSHMAMETPILDLGSGSARLFTTGSALSPRSQSP